MVAVAGMTTRRYYTLDSAPGTVRGQVRAMFEAAHVSAQDGHTWEAHPRDAMHILLEEETRDNNNNNKITIITLARRLAQRRAAWRGTWRAQVDGNACAPHWRWMCGSAAGCEQGRRHSRRGGIDEGRDAGQCYTCRV